MQTDKRSSKAKLKKILFSKVKQKVLTRHHHKRKTRRRKNKELWEDLRRLKLN